MEITVRQISSLEKIRGLSDIPKNSITQKTLLGGEHFSYQIALASEEECDVYVSLSSPIAEQIKVYAVESAAMDYPIYPYLKDDDIITDKPGIMPDILVPLELMENYIKLNGSTAVLWVEAAIPNGFAAGEYPVNISFQIRNADNKEDAVTVSRTMTLTVLNIDLPEQKTIFTQWFHVDCIASLHNEEIYSEEHWSLIDKYMALASDLGINMILTPVITPPLDTQIGKTRPCTQLVHIVKNGEKYSFDFTLLKRWLELCRKNNFKYYEIAHLFSQWGLEYSPNIWVWERGEKVHMFGWHVPAQSEEYKEFLKQFVPSLVEFLKSEAVFDKCCFHLSDEPLAAHMENYRYAYDLVVPMLDGARTMDALSDETFYDEGLVETPITAVNHMKPFLERKAKHQWTYYCCMQSVKVSNRFLTFPSYRNRIIGVQLYKYGIEGFLHWGYNFYYSRLSRFEINPYITSSASRGFPSGDAFSVYPYKDRPVPSLRALIFKEALQDADLMYLLENYIGKDEVIKLIEDEADMEITVEEYPRNSEFLPRLNEKLKQKLQEVI